MRHTYRLLVIGHDQRTREIVKGIQAYCRLQGHWEFHWDTGGGPSVVPRLRAAINQWKADGIITHIRADWFSRLARRSGRPLVNLSGARDTDLPTVISDYFAVGRMVARHFLDSGFRNFGFCAKTFEPYVQRMCSAFVDEFAEAGFGCNVFADEFTGRLETDLIKNSRRADQWLLSLKKPVAVLCIYDTRGYEVVMACRRLGLRVPDDVAIVSVGNDATLCEMCTPSLSSIDVNLQKIGYEAIQMLHRIIRGGKLPSKRVLVAPRGVVVRGSSDMIAVADPDVAAAMRFIRDHGHEPLRVKEILREMSISRRTLEAKFLKTLSRSPAEEITRVRMGYIKNLLADANLPVPAVAKKMGFSRTDVFSVFFRREMGMTPTQYRKGYRADAMASIAAPLH